METKFKLVKEDELLDPQYYTFCSSLWKNGKQLGLDFEEIPDISADVGLYTLNKRYGRYNQTKIDPYKQTLDFVNTLNNELRELIEEAFQPVEVYDFIYENGQFNYR